MKSQKGVTLTSLGIYIVLILIVLGILATITASFQSNIKEIYKEGTNNAEIDKFNVYFLKEVKKQGNEIDTISENEIVFTLGNKYTFKDDNCIYLNHNIKIAENIEKCLFSTAVENEKTVITVTIKAINGEQKAIEYVLNDKAYYSSYEDESDYIHSNISVLPSGYVEVEYLESTGIQYIDTGFIPNQDTRVICEAELEYCTLSGAVGYHLFGARTNSTSNLFSFSSWDNKYETKYGSETNELYSSELGKFTVDKNRNVTNLYVDGELISSSSQTYVTFTTVEKLSLFGTMQSSGIFGTEGNKKIYKCEIYNNDVLVRNFIPCLDQNDIPCMYDTVYEETFYNQGTGDDFIAGPEV